MEIYLLHFPVAITHVVLFSLLNINFEASKMTFWLLYTVITVGGSVFVKKWGTFC